MKSNETVSNVVDLKNFKRTRELETQIARGRTPLHVSHIDGKVKGSPHLRNQETDDFGDRMQRIRSSLEKINQLMADLKNTNRAKEIED
ncbi:MAG: hypothetical protein EOP04_24795 [Proteobacteria bacterium]|nr:MAG: hypothetical protein EOP04_24795 [Pseudomonadota bacterium]